MTSRGAVSPPVGARAKAPKVHVIARGDSCMYQIPAPEQQGSIGSINLDGYGLGVGLGFAVFGPPLAHCKPKNRSLAGPFSLCANRGLREPSALRRRPTRARSVSESPPSLSTRSTLLVRRVENPQTFQETDRIALRPCFAGSGLFQSRRRRDRGGVVVGISWEF